jgi:hypothetical protein
MQTAFLHACKEEPPKEGWLTGFEPATARTTIWSSTVELQPPFSERTRNLVEPGAAGNLKIHPAWRVKVPTGSLTRKRFLRRLRREEMRFPP